MSALSFIFLLGIITVGQSSLRRQKAYAADCSTTTITITQASTNVFYIDKDTSPLLDSAYVSYRIQTGASASFSDLWVSAGSFSDSTKLKLAPNETGLTHIGALSTNATTYVYFYLQGAVTAAAQSYTLSLYNGHPSYGGTTTCTKSVSHASVDDTIEAAANKVTSVVTSAPYIGGDLTMTVTGDTGTIGSAGVFAYSPSSISTWPADCYELKDTSIVMSGGNTGTFTKGLMQTGLSSGDTHYVITYTLTAKCTTAGPTSVTPLNMISSGTQIKHTNVGTASYTSIPAISPASNTITLAKTASAAGAGGASTPTYSLTLTNTAAVAVSVDGLRDTLPSSPASVTYVNGTSTYNGSAIANPTISGQTLTWTSTFSIPANSTRTLTFQASVPATTGTYTNTATAFIESTQIDTTTLTSDNSPATVTYNVGTPNLSTSTKSVSDLNGGVVAPGDTLRYTITVINSGTTTGSGIAVTDTIDGDTENLTNVQNSNCGTLTNGSSSSALNLTNVTVAVGVNCVITFDVSVKTPLNEGTSIANTATISAASEGGTGATPSSVTQTVDATPTLIVTKSEDDVDNNVSPSQTVGYTIQIQNSGNGRATGISLSDTIDSDVALDTGSFGLLNCGTPSNTSTSSLGQLASIAVEAGATCTITYNVAVNGGATNGASIPNSVDVSGATEGGSDPSPVSSTTLTVVVASNPDLSTSTKAVVDINGGVVEPGDTLRYTISIINSGSSTGSGISVADTIDTDTENLTNVIIGAESTSCGPSTINTSTPTALAVGGVRVTNATTCKISFEVTVKSPLNEATPISNSATISAALEGGSDSSPSSTTLYTDSSPNLSVTYNENDSDNSVDPLQTVQYTITISNNGNGLGSGVDLSGSIVGSVGAMSNFNFTNCGGAYLNSSTASTVDIQNLAIAPSVDCVITFEVSVNGNAAGSSTITSSVNPSAADEGGNDPAVANASTLTVSSTPILDVVKEEDDSDNIVIPGQLITYSITIHNGGNATGSTSLTDNIPSGFSAPSNFDFANCGSANPHFASPLLTIDSLQVSTSVDCVITYDVSVLSGLTEGSILTNSVDVAAATEGGGDPSPVSASSLVVDITPNLSTSTKSVTDLNGGVIVPGDTLRYTITIKNTGDGLGSGISVSDTIDSDSENLTNIQISSCGSTSDSSTSSALSLTSISVAVGVDCVVTFDVTVKSPSIEGTNITNTATISASSQGGPGATPSSSTQSVDATPHLSITSEDNDVDNTVQPSQTVTYTLTITNDGDGTGTVSVVDTITGSVSDIANVQLTNCGSDYSDSTTGKSLLITGVKVSTTSPCVISFETTVDSNAAGGSSITDSADVSVSAEGGTDPAGDSADTLTVATTPDLSVSKSEDDTDNSVIPGQTITYTIQITNSGNGTGTTSLADPINAGFGSPANIQYSDCGSPSSDFTVPNLTITNISIGTGSPCIITYELTIDSPLNEGTTLTNTVDVAVSTQGGNDPDPESASTLTVDATPNLSTSTKTVSDTNGGTVAPGDTLRYTVRIKNTGTGRATGVSATDTIDTDTENLSNLQRTDCGSSTNGSSSTALSVTNITVDVGIDCVIIFDVNVKSPLTEGTTIANTVTISVSNEGGLGASPSSPTKTVDTTPYLTVTVTDDDSDNLLQRSQSVTHTITITNTGNGDASGVSVAGSIIGQTGSLTNFTATNCGSATDGSTGKTLSVSTVSVAVGTPCVVTYLSAVSSDAAPRNKIKLSADVGAANEGGNDPALVYGSELVVQAPKVEITISTDSVTQLSMLEYEVIYSVDIVSSGNLTATDIQAHLPLNDLLTSGISLVSLETSRTDDFLTNGTLNTGYDGITNTNLFNTSPTGVSLDPEGGNDRGIIRVRVVISRPIGVAIPDINADATADSGINETSNLTSTLMDDPDGDGFITGSESVMDDRDNDGINDSEDFDPQGFFYCSATGQIIKGGRITVSGPGDITYVADGEDGYYQWFASGTAGLYTMSITAPSGTRLDPARISTEILDPTGKSNPYSLGSSQFGTTGYLSDFTYAANPYYLRFDIEDSDPWIINNNIPLIQCGDLAPNTGLGTYNTRFYSALLGTGSMIMAYGVLSIEKRKIRNNINS